MRVQDVMTRNVKTVSPGAKAEDAWTTMRNERIHHLVVTDGKEIVGVLSDRDVGSRGGAAVRSGRSVADLMSGRVVTVDPTATIRKAANLMRGHTMGCVVIAQKGRPVGILTTADLLDLIGQGAERPIADPHRHTLSHKVPHRKRHQSTGAW